MKELIEAGPPDAGSALIEGKEKAGTEPASSGY